MSFILREGKDGKAHGLLTSKDVSEFHDECLPGRQGEVA
jgi:hypothetical protein